jgi:hypothetical protein
LQLDNSLIRFFIVLPEPVNFPDGYRIAVAPKVERKFIDEGIPFVHLEFMQIEDASRRLGELNAALKAVERSRTGKVQRRQGGSETGLNGSYTIVAATTPADLDSSGRGEWETPQDIPIHRDAFNRCLAAVTELVRGYRVAFEATCAVPAYERLTAMVLSQTTAVAIVSPDIPGFLDVDSCKWSDPSAYVLDHFNSPDAAGAEFVSDDPEGRLLYFGEMLDQGSPLFTWRERYVDARRAQWVEGRYDMAVTLAITASEVLLDGILSLLLWESKEDPKVLGGFFAEGKLVKRVKGKYPELLGGNWSLDAGGPVSEWFHKAFKVRHRVVHGGYVPTRIEGQVALDSVHSLSLHCWERIAERCSDFPRTALITLSEEGLKKRGKWSGRMERFRREVAVSEGSWLESSAAWRAELNEAALAAMK